MSSFGLIGDLALIWAAALLAGLVCVRLKQPVIAGYILAGVMVGPHGLKLIGRSEEIDVLAEFGVAMLLFALGVDLSLKKVISSAARILSAGLTQVVATIAVGWLIAWASSLATTVGEGFLFGSICAISSSVIISRTLMDRGELDSIHGQILVPLSLVQDLSLIAIIPFLPVLQHTAGADLSSLAASGLKALLFILIVVFGATKVIPVILERSAKANSKEIFLMTVLVLCLAIATLSQTLGLSIALGAFLAGIMMSESIYAHQALHDVAPLRDIFSVVFFVSVGMLLDPSFIAGHWLVVLLFVTALVVGKAIIGAISAMLATSNLRSAILVGVGLSQIGEFSFVLLTLGQRYHLINQSIYNLFFAGAIVSMIASPGLMSLVPKLMRRSFKNGPEPVSQQPPNDLRNHVVVCGFGRIGRNLGHVLEAFDLPFIVIELNANIIEDLAMRGIKHIYGDAMNQIVLAKAQLKDAGMLVLTMPDPLSAEAVAVFARALNPDIKIVARAHRTDDIRLFREAGVNAVVQPEFEASIEITRLVLHGLNRPIAEVQHALSVIKTKRYAIFQAGNQSDDLRPIHHLDLNDDQMGIWFTVTSAGLDGKSIADLNVRGETGATITAVRRKDRSVAFPEPLFELKHHDRVYAVGNFEQLRQLEGKFALAQAEK